MKTETFYPQKIAQQFTMEPMHDDSIESMELQDDRLIITYNHLTQGILKPDGTPYYQYDKLTITYRFESYCDFILCSRFKRREIPFSKVLTLLQTKKSHLEAYKYMVDSFGELVLVFFIHKRNRPCAQLYIKLDPSEITYVWEDDVTRS